LSDVTKISSSPAETPAGSCAGGMAPEAGKWSDDALLSAIAQQDRQAFLRLMERHSRKCLALAQRVSGRKEDAEEIVQEAFLKIWLNADRWRPGGNARFSTWLYRIVLNLCIDRKRRPKFEELEEADSIPDPTAHDLSALAAAERSLMLDRALAQLPERQRAAVAVYYFGDIGSAEAAASLDLSLSAFESLLVRGRKGLRRILSSLGVRDLSDLL